MFFVISVKKMIASGRFFMLAAFVIALVLYFLTNAPDVTFTDSGELAAVCSSLGVAHPTGYPLFTILGYFWTLLPLGLSDVASLNVFAAFLTAAAAAVFFEAVRALFNFYVISKSDHANSKNNHTNSKSNSKQNKNRNAQLFYDAKTVNITAFIATLIFISAKTVWEQSASVEVYSMHLLIINLIFLLILKAFQGGEREKNFLLLAAFLLGCGFANHMTTVLLLPGILFAYFYSSRDGFDFSAERMKFFLVLMIPFFIGLSFYIYLPLRSAGDPLFNWGWVSRSFDKFWYHISGRQYQVWMFSGDAASVNFNKFVTVFPYQLGFIGIIPMLWGFVRLFKSSKQVALLLAITFVVCLIYSLNYSIHDIDNYFLAAIVAALFLAAVGLLDLAYKYKKILPLFLLIPLLNIGLNYSENDKSGDYAVAEYTRILTDNLQPDAIVISAQWDFWCAAFWYNQQIESVRKDIVLLEKELLRRTWYSEQFRQWYPETASLCGSAFDEYLRELEKFESDELYDAMRLQGLFVNAINCIIDENYAKRPIYITLDILQSDKEIAAQYQKIPDGFAFRLEKKFEGHDVNADNMDTKLLESSIAGRNGHLYDGIRELTALNFVNIGRYCYASGDYENAKQALQHALRIDKNNESAQQGLREIRDLNLSETE